MLPVRGKARDAEISRRDKKSVGFSCHDNAIFFIQTAIFLFAFQLRLVLICFGIHGLLTATQPWFLLVTTTGCLSDRLALYIFLQRFDFL